MLEVELSPSQQKMHDSLDEAMETLKNSFISMEKFDYNARYAALNRSEKKWAKHQDYEQDPPQDLSITPIRFDAADIEVLQDINKMQVNVGERISRLSKEKTRAQKNLSDWKTLYKSCKELKEEMEAFWMTVAEIRGMKSKEIREAEIMLRMLDMNRLFRAVSVYFWEGKHNDHGEALAYFEAVRDAIKSYDKEAEKVSRQLSTFKEMRPAHEG
jgi:hypothetical protein